MPAQALPFNAILPPFMISVPKSPVTPTSCVQILLFCPGVCHVCWSFGWCYVCLISCTLCVDNALKNIIFQIKVRSSHLKIGGDHTVYRRYVHTGANRRYICTGVYRRYIYTAEGLSPPFRATQILGPGKQGCVRAGFGTPETSGGARQRRNTPESPPKFRRKSPGWAARRGRN